MRFNRPVDCKKKRASDPLDVKFRVRSLRGGEPSGSDFHSRACEVDWKVVNMGASVCYTVMWGAAGCFSGFAAPFNFRAINFDAEVFLCVLWTCCTGVQCNI